MREHEIEEIKELKEKLKVCTDMLEAISQTDTAYLLQQFPDIKHHYPAKGLTFMTGADFALKKIGHVLTADRLNKASHFYRKERREREQT